MGPSFSRAWHRALTAGARHRGLIAALVAAWIAVIARSVVYVCYEQAFFDSDQAIFGLMAKHLIEGRAFPLFCYGQPYMLVVDSWVAAVFFLAMGANVAALHTALVFVNLVTVTVLVVALVRHAGLRPGLAWLAALPFAFAPPDTAATLIEAGGSIGPLLYVLLLWLLQNRPLWFGLVLGVGLLHREFTVYAVPVLLAQQAWTGSLWRISRLQGWAVAAVVAVGTWQAGQALRPYADALGPGTRGTAIEASAGVGAVAERIEFVPAELPGRITTMLWRHLPGLFGGRERRGVTRQGHDWLFWPFTAILVAGLFTGLGVLRRSRWGQSGVPTDRMRAASPRTDLPLYLVGVGLLAVVGYIVTRPEDFFQDRYMMLALYLPVGAAVAVFSNAARWMRLGVAAGVVLLAGGSAVDHGRLVAQYAGGRTSNDLRVLADGLVARGITAAQSGYWRAYKVTFLTGERVKIASTDYVRIEEYQRLAREQGADVVTIQAEPCPGGEYLGGHYLCRRPR